MRSRWVYIVYAKDPANLIIIIIYFQTRSATRTTPPVDKMSRFSGSNTPGKPVAAENLGFSWYGMVSRGFLLEMC